MNDLDTEIRDAFERLAAHAPELDLDPVLRSSQARHGAARRLHRWAPALTAVATAIAVAAVAVVFTRGDSNTPGVDTNRPGANLSAIAVPPGMQEVSYHGAQIDVPSSYKLFPYGACSSPTIDAVVTVAGSFGCILPAYGGPGPDYSKLTEVVLAPMTSAADSNDGHLQALATHDVTIAGKPALEGVGKLQLGFDNRNVTVLVIPSAALLISVRSNDLELAKRILATVRLTAIDRKGCLGHLDSWHPTAVENRHGDSGTRLVPGSPVVGAICNYTDDWLVQSVAIPAGALSKDLEVLNGLPEGMTRYVFGQSAPDGCESAKRDGTLLHFRYSDDSAQTVWVHTSGCIGMSANNGTLRTQISGELVELIQNGGLFGSLPTGGSNQFRPMTEAEIRQFASQQP